VKTWLKPRTIESFFIGIFLAGLQLSIALVLAPGQGLYLRYSQLCKWDCRWYEAVARDGYRSSIPPVAQNSSIANVAFFPAYPYLARSLHQVLNISSATSLLIVAQIFSILFWMTLWFLLRAWRIPVGLAVLATLTIFTHPAAFFLVTGYSESLFLACLITFVLLTSSTQNRSRIRAAGAGFIMSATRIIGIVVAVYPLLVLAASRVPGTDSPRGAVIAKTPSVLDSAALAGITAAGAGAFFWFCKLRFGQFDLYMETQRIGWGIIPDYSVIFRLGSLKYSFAIDQLATRISTLAFGLMFLLEAYFWLRFRISGLKKRLPIYVIAFLIFYLSISGLSSVGFRSMIRYSLPWHILLVLSAAHLLSQRYFARLHRIPVYATGLVLAASLVGFWFTVQVPNFKNFLHGLWFA